MIAPIVWLVAGLAAAPELALPAGAPIDLDGLLAAREWAGAFEVRNEPAGGQKVRLLLKRTGPWLAIGLESNRPYHGEVARLKVAGGAGAWIADMVLGIGQPSAPPLLWRRASPAVLRRAPPGAGAECPRGCRVRVHVRDPERWSAEYLVLLRTLGIGRADRREFRFHFTLRTGGREPRDLLRLPADVKDPADPAQYARFVSPDGWGAQERWDPVSAAISKEFDDHQLLFRLHREHEGFAAREAPELLVIASAVRPRSMTRINLLREALERGRSRNPTLPSWDYFLGRLLHEGNLYAEARRIVESIPKNLRSLDPFVNLAAEHYIDTGDWEKALAVCDANKGAFGMHETIRLALAARAAAKTETEARAADAQKPEKNPVVRFVTAKGEFKAELFEDDAPHAVKNFMDLVLHRNYYDGLRFIEVGGGSFVRTGDPRTRPGATGREDGPPWRLRKDESGRPPLRGVLATVPVEGNAYHGSQFIVTVAPMFREAKKLAVFGRVIEGQEVVDSLEQDDRLVRIEVISRRNHAYDALGARYHQ